MRVRASLAAATLAGLTALATAALTGGCTSANTTADSTNQHPTTPAAPPSASPKPPPPVDEDGVPRVPIAERPFFTLTDQLDTNFFAKGFEPGIDIVWAPFHKGVHAELFYVAMRADIPLHYHKTREETLFVLDGEGSLLLANRRVHLEPGVMVRLAPGIAHGWEGARRNPLKALVIVTPPFEGNAGEADDLVTSRVDAPGVFLAPWIEDITSPKLLPPLLTPGKGESASALKKVEADRSAFSTVNVVAIRQGKIPDHVHEHHDEVAIVFAKKGYGFIRANETVNVVDVGSIAYLPEGTIHSVQHVAEGHLRAVTLHFPAYDESDTKIAPAPEVKSDPEKDGGLQAPTDPGFFRVPREINPQIVQPGVDPDPNRPR